MWRTSRCFAQNDNRTHHCEHSNHFCYKFAIYLQNRQQFRPLEDSQAKSWVLKITKKFWHSGREIFSLFSISFLSCVVGYVYHLKKCIINTTNFTTNIPSHTLCIFTAPNWPGHPNCQGYMITLRHNSLAVNPLDEWSGRIKYLYLTTQDTRKRQSWMLPAGIETSILAKRAAVEPRLSWRGHSIAVHARGDGRTTLTCAALKVMGLSCVSTAPSRFYRNWDVLKVLCFPSSFRN